MVVLIKKQICLKCTDVKSIVTVPLSPFQWFVKAEWRVEATAASV